MDKPYKHPRSYLFTVRLWQEEVDHGQIEWRGQVHLITAGNVRYFQGWKELVSLLTSMLAEVDALSEPNS